MTQNNLLIFGSFKLSFFCYFPYLAIAVSVNNIYHLLDLPLAHLKLKKIF